MTDTPAPLDLPALVELRAIAKSLGLMAEPLLDAAPNNGQARRRERDDLIVNLRRAEGRVLDAMQAIRVALTLQRDQEATAHEDAMSDIDRSDEADARRFRWLLDGRGRFMERRWLCCSFPVSSQVEQDDARRAIDKAAIDEAEAWPI